MVSETLPALQKLKEKGLVRHIGITGLPLKIFKYVIDRVPPGTVDVVLSYCHYSLNDQSMLDLLPYLKERNIGVINASPLSMGLLTPQVCPLPLRSAHATDLTTQLLAADCLTDCAVSVICCQPLT